VVICDAGDIIPGDGEVIEGIATVDESVITGESAPVIRESGGDRSAVTGGTKVLSDQIKIRITSNPGETFLDRMIALVEGAERQKTPNEIALNILIAGPDADLPAGRRHLQPFAATASRNSGAGRIPSVAVLVSLLVCLIPTTIGGLLSAIGIAGMDRVMQHNVLAMSGKAVEAPATSTRCCSIRPAPSRWATGRPWNFFPSTGVTEERLADAAQLIQPGRRNSGRPLHRGAGQTRSTACAGARWPSTRPLHPLLRLHPHERRDIDGRACAKAPPMPSCNSSPSKAASSRELHRMSIAFLRTAARLSPSPTEPVCWASFI
jgi:hypothetical protein